MHCDYVQTSSFLYRFFFVLGAMTMDLSNDAKASLIALSSLFIVSSSSFVFLILIILIVVFIFDVTNTILFVLCLFSLSISLRGFLHDRHERRNDGVHEDDDEDDDVDVTDNASFHVSSAFEDDIAIHHGE